MKTLISVAVVALFVGGLFACGTEDDPTLGIDEQGMSVEEAAKQPPPPPPPSCQLNRNVCYTQIQMQCNLLYCPNRSACNPVARDACIVAGMSQCDLTYPCP